METPELLKSFEEDSEHDSDDAGEWTPASAPPATELLDTASALHALAAARTFFSFSENQSESK